MLSGINYSPPLYFLLNFIGQLVHPVSIETLRIQSLLYSLIGLFICFLITRKSFGIVPSLVGTVLVASNSDILLEQSQEARNYTLFFACGAWVLYTQVCDKKNQKWHFFFTFLAHLCLCQVHYLGIIFSSLVGLSYLISNKQSFLLKRIPNSIYASWAISLPLYFYYLTKQQSLLNTWPKPNSLTHLLGMHGDHMITLLSITPLLVISCIIGNSLDRRDSSPEIERPALITSFFWYVLPLLAWVISQFFPLNLFTERYFIPREAAFIFLISYVCSRIKALSLCNELSSKVFRLVPALSVLTLCLTFVSLNFKRSSFAYNEDINYHHWLILKGQLVTSEVPIVYFGDPVFFPNSYLHPKQSHFFLDNAHLKKAYSKFSSEIKIVDSDTLQTFDSFIIVTGRKKKLPQSITKSFQGSTYGQFNKHLPLFSTRFDKNKDVKAIPPS
mgnify:CR=1 FL=1